MHLLDRHLAVVVFGIGLASQRTPEGEVLQRRRRHVGVAVRGVHVQSEQRHQLIQPGVADRPVVGLEDLPFQEVQRGYSEVAVSAEEGSS